jgi:hypothetical protein
MQVSDDSSKPIFILPRWARVGMAFFMFAVTAVSMWKGFFRLDWAPFFCLGLYYLVYVPRQKGEVFAAYIKKPRSIASLGLLCAAIATAGRGLFALFAK